MSAVHSIDHYALNVPSLKEAHRFFETFGLEVRDLGDRLELLAQDEHVWAHVLPAQRKSLAYITFHCFEFDLASLRQQVESTGTTLVERDGDGFWFQDPDGNLIQVKVGDKYMPDSLTPEPPESRQLRGTGTRADVTQIRPRRLSHLLLFSPDVTRAVAFYNQALGLKLSDHSQDIIAFTHAPHGCDHHLMAFCSSTAKGFHHAAWDVPDIDCVGNGAAQMAAAGYLEGWGTGRHCLGSNYFHYVRDPWGSFCEYSAHMDFITAGTDWPSGDFPPENSLYLWGPEVPDYFIFNTEAEGAPPSDRTTRELLAPH